MRVRLNTSPQSHDISEMNVFISFRRCDWDKARTIARAIQERGFNVQVFEPLDSIVTQPEEDVRGMLREALQKADYICFVNTFDALSSEWIAYEFVVASRTLGRVTFINTGPAISGYESVQKLYELGKRFAMNLLHIKHTTAQLEDLETENIDRLITEMMNDPDCGWVDGRQQDASGRFPPSDGLKSESLLRKHARRLVLEDAQFNDHYIVEVIPFLLSRSDHIPQMRPEDHFRSLLIERGMLTLLDDFDSGRVFVSRVEYVPSFESDQDCHMYVYVVREHKETQLGGSLPDSITMSLRKLFSALKQTNKIQVFEGKRPATGTGDAWTGARTYTDPRDHQEYRTVIIEGKTWFAENLRFESRESCYYDNDADHAKKYGCLYTWSDAARSVPPGWRLPTFNEWSELAVHFGGFVNNLEGGVGDATKSFEALIEGGSSTLDIMLGGFRYYDGTFKYLSVDGYYWSITEYNQNSAYMLYFLGGDGKTVRGTAFKTAAHSVRCIRDAT